MEGFPYPPRPGQARLMDLVRQAGAGGGQLAVESGTGTGKTVATLAALLAVAAEDSRPVVWTTRTNSQQTQVMREHHALAAAGAPAGLIVPFMGRRQYCPLLREDDRFRDGTPEELGRLCRDAKQKARTAADTGKPVKGACPYYERLLRDGTGPVEGLLASAETPAAVAHAIERAGSCPYEALKLLIPAARVVVVPHIFLLEASLRDALLGWMGTGPDDVHLVIDEAHHLPAAAREHHSPRLTATALTRAQKEAVDYQDPNLGGITLATTLIDALRRVLYRMVEEHVHNDEDGLVPAGLAEEELMRELRTPSPGLARVAVALLEWGQAIRDDKQARGRLPRSHLGALGAFLHLWLGDLEGERVQIATGGDNPSLERYLLDPAPVLGWLQDFWSVVHMSGTLAPLADHALQCGLPPDARQERIPSPFDADQLRLACVAGLHRRHRLVLEDPTVTERQQAWASTMLDRLPGRCGLFFPSHDMLAAYLEEGFLHGTDRPLHVERPGMDQGTLSRLVDAFRRDVRPGALLLGVLGGRLTEGIDFPGDAMEAALLFGVPYPRPCARSEALIQHFDRVAGRGWSIAVQTPVGRVMRQAVGRLVRGPEDRGVAVILDERAVRFHDHLPGLRVVETPDEVVAWEARTDGYRRATTIPRPAPTTAPEGGPLLSTGSDETK